VRAVVEREGDAAVPGPLAHDFRLRAAQEAERDVRVPQVVEADRLRQFGPAKRLLEVVINDLLAAYGIPGLRRPNWVMVGVGAH
jgi:hypothetical protein